MFEHTPLSLSEDDNSRSRYMWQLIQNRESYISQGAKTMIPRILVQFWDDIEYVPLDVQQCMKSWRPLTERGFKRLLFDDTSAKQFITDHFEYRYLDAFERCRHPAMRSDYFRLCFIYQIGGFYVDADDVYLGTDIERWFHDERLKIQPLCYDISTDLMIDVADFMTSPTPSINHIYYVNNDPIIAPPNHPLIAMALERSTNILLTLEGNPKDVQSTTGPGNLTASLVRHAYESSHEGNRPDFLLLDNWHMVSRPQWPLEYRKDKRNWRFWDGKDDM